MFLCICLAFYFYGDFVLSVFVFFFLRLLSCIFLSIFFLFLFDVGSFLFFIFVLSECWVFMVLCVLLPACPLVVAFAFVGLILWSCCSQGSVPMQFRCPHLFQPFLFWWWSLRYLFLRPAPLVSCALFGCIVFCFLPFSWPVCCFVIIPRYIFTRLLYLGLTFFGILLVARYFITCLDVSSIFSLSIFLRKVHLDVLLLNTTRLSACMQVWQSINFPPWYHNMQYFYLLFLHLFYLNFGFIITCSPMMSFLFPSPVTGVIVNFLLSEIVASTLLVVWFGFCFPFFYLGLFISLVSASWTA